jgi:hypothetical protein
VSGDKRHSPQAGAFCAIAPVLFAYLLPENDRLHENLSFQFFSLHQELRSDLDT